VLAALVAGGAYAVWALVLSGGDTVTAEVQTATVERGSISQTVSTTGTVAAQSTTELSFDQSGRVSAVSVTLGQEVKAGDVLAEIESDELQDSVTQAEVNLTTAQTKLSQLLKGSDASELASADQSLIQAQASYDQAVRALEDLSDGPSDSERLSAEQSVISAQAQLDQANLELADLTTDPLRRTALGEQAYSAGAARPGQPRAE
jgi:multidrug efflux pump subunit AcrA (membrane-fusion protein)